MIDDRKFIWTALIYGILGVTMIATLYPMVYVLSMSISNPDAVVRQEVWLLPKGFSLRSYELVFKNPNVFQSYYNTLWYTIVGTALNIVMTVTAAYPLSRKELVGRSQFMMFIAVTMFFSGGLIPQFILVNSMGMYNTRWAIVIPAMLSAINIVIARVYFQTTISDALVESAKIEGCNDFTILLRIVLPLSAPILSVIGLYSAVGFWNSYFGPVIYLSNADLHPMTLFLQRILIVNDMSSALGSAGMDVAMGERLKFSMQIKYALIVVTVVPILFLYPFVQKYFVQGVMIGAIKE
jgi:putative aldouronate transport system permease protein